VRRTAGAWFVAQVGVLARATQTPLLQQYEPWKALGYMGTRILQSAGKNKYSPHHCDGDLLRFAVVELRYRVEDDKV
jgi:hypothetical protein